MPADIRSFFGNKNPVPKKENARGEGGNSTSRRNKSRQIIEDSEDEEQLYSFVLTISLQSYGILTIATGQIKWYPQSLKKNPCKYETSEKGEPIATSDYFASSINNKPISSAAKSSASINGVSKRPHTLKKATSSYPESKDDAGTAKFDDDDPAGEVFASQFKTVHRRKYDEYVDLTSDEDIEPKPKKIATKDKLGVVDKKRRKNDSEDYDVSKDNKFPNGEGSPGIKHDDQEKSSPISKRKGPRKAEPQIKKDNDHKESVDSVKPKPKKPTSGSKPRASGKKTQDEPESSSVQAILDSISTVRAPTPPPKDPDAKWNWKSAQTGGNSGPPPAAGTKDIPMGQENCLAGLTFVFTGLLETLAREEAQELVKRYGGKVTGGPSRKTSFVVLGNDAGPSKLRKIQELSLKTIDEDGLLELIRVMPANGGDGKEAEKNMKKKMAEMEKIKIEAEEMEREENQKIEKASNVVAAKMHGSSAAASRQPVLPSSQLWTTKYAPTSINQICGNKSSVEKIQNWLKGWPLAHKYNFQKKGPHGLGGYRAIIIHGPPGIGKTTAAHLAAKLTGYDVLESNASDTRSKKLVETGLKEVLDNNSLLGYFTSAGKEVDKQKKKIVLIMDEVDGMSAGDRGGVGALAQVCRKTNIPLILICNERKLPKMKPFDMVTHDIPFRKPTVEQVRSRIATICHRENLKIPPNVMDALIEGSNKDIRQVINMISAAKLDQSTMDFDQGKAMSKSWEKHIVLKPWDICHKLLSGGMFAPSSKATLNDKIELYFNDHEFSYLMIQENYLSTKPSLSQNYDQKKARLRALQLSDDAAQSISDGDLVDRMIHGSQQQWSLMPTHAIFSTVRPASFIAGMMTGQTSFTRWLGSNSKQQKLSRYIKEIQSHMRLRTSGDRHEIRQQYIPVLWAETVKRLEAEGKECVNEVIDLMDSYFLTKDDFDYIMELGLGPQDMEKINIETQTKATFTRLYNQRTHPMPFMKASNIVAPSKTIKEVPDLEEAFEEEDDGEIVAEPKQEDEEIDFKKDKYIKQPKKPAAKKSATKVDHKDVNEDNNDNKKPSKKRITKPKAASKGKPKK
ncbi:Replication factor C subunit 1 [Podosphaera aphanis]|nr:Replication factor C subunit 1 [Podosphaera aphanis]